MTNALRPARRTMRVTLLFFALAALFMSPLGAALAASPLTIEDVMRIEQVTNVAISPEGSTIAYTLAVPRDLASEKSGSAWSRLYVTDFEGGSPRLFVGGEVNVSSIAFSPDGERISYVAKRGDDEHAAIWVIPTGGGESRALVRHEARIHDYAWRPDGRGIAWVGDLPKSKEEEKLEEKGFNAVVFEEDWARRAIWTANLGEDGLSLAGEPRRLDNLPGQPSELTWTPDGRQLVAALAPTALVDDHLMFRRLHLLDARSGEVVRRFENPGKLGHFEVSPEGKTLALMSGHDINDADAGRLMRVPLEGGELKDVLPELFDKGSVEGFTYTSEGELLYIAAIGVNNRLGIVGAEPIDLGDGSPALSSMAASRDGARVAFVGHTPKYPREVLTWDRAKGEGPTRVTMHNPWLAKRELAEQEIVRYEARDGLMIEGLLIHPLERAEGQRVPLIVVAHGGPESHYPNGWVTRYSSPGHVGAAEGYAIFYPNYRAGTGRGVPFLMEGFGDPGGKEFNDVLDGIDYLIERGLVDKERVGITGGSYGGFFTAWGSTRHSERFAAGVMFVGLSNHLSKLGTSDIPMEMKLVHWNTTAWEDTDFALERSPISYIDKANTPLLILHGKEDTRVHVSQSMELHRALKMKGDVPVRMILYPGEGHGNRKIAAQYDYMLRMMRWFDTFLMKDAEEKPDWVIEPELGEKGEEKAAAK